MRTLLGWVLFIAIALLSLTSVAEASTRGCAVMWDGDAVPDRDCDGVPDTQDNCPAAPNAQQQDLDRDGTGDACAPLIDAVLIEPDSHILQGEFARITFRAVNDRGLPVSDVSITVTQRTLGINETARIASVPVGETATVDVWMRAPPCARPGTYTLDVVSSFREGSSRDPTTERAQARLVVEESEACGAPQGALDATIIDVFGSTQVERAESVIIPISITNKGDAQATYHASVQDLAGWGTWRIDPAPSILLPAGRDGTLYLYLATDSMTPPGPRTVTLSVASQGQVTQVPITVQVRAPLASAASTGGFLVEAIAIAAVMILIGIIGVLAVVQLNRRHKGTSRKDKDADDKNGKDDAPVSGSAGGDAPAAGGSAAKASGATRKVEKKAAQPPKAAPAKTARKVSVEKAEGPSIETYY